MQRGDEGWEIEEAERIVDALMRERKGIVEIKDEEDEG